MQILWRRRCSCVVDLKLPIDRMGTALKCTKMIEALCTLFSLFVMQICDVFLAVVVPAFASR